MPPPPQIPDTFAIGVQTCLDTCKLQRTPQPQTQLVPRVIGNGFPAPNNSRRENEGSLVKRYENPEELVEEELVEMEPVVTSSPSTFSSLISAADVQTLGELIFLLKIVMGVMLSGYVFTWVYFVIPTWRSRKLHAELQARAAAAALSAPRQDIKA